MSLVLATILLVAVVVVGWRIKNHISHSPHVAGATSFTLESIIHYIEEYNSIGYSKEQIIAHLVKNGVPLKDVNHAFAAYENGQVAKAS